MRKRRFGADRRLYLWQAGLVACVVSIFVHSMTYNAFFEDPYLWLFMALASACRHPQRAGASRLAAAPAGGSPTAATPTRRATPAAPTVGADARLPPRVEC